MIHHLDISIGTGGAQTERKAVQGFRYWRLVGLTTVAENLSGLTCAPRVMMVPPGSTFAALEYLVAVCGDEIATNYTALLTAAPNMSSQMPLIAPALFFVPMALGWPNVWFDQDLDLLLDWVNPAAGAVFHNTHLWIETLKPGR